MERLGNVRLRKYFASAPKLAAIINFEINRAWAGLQVVTKMALKAQEDSEKYRFQVELEFVQCLANPQYLNYQQLLHWHHYTKKRMQFQHQIMSHSKPAASSK
ncbi:hypothetical protein EMCRGX_G020010 [Ephydatia muelleri]